MRRRIRELGVGKLSPLAVTMTLLTCEEGDTFMSYEEEDTCMYDVAYL
jgi:hypothetical protein